jgi:hypothetical protein
MATTFWKCHCKAEIVIGGMTEAVQRLLREIDLATTVGCFLHESTPCRKIVDAGNWTAI